jgi:ATP adenylyltransferase
MAAVETHAERGDEPPAPAPGELWAQVRARARRALEAGAMVPLETRAEVIQEAGVPFSVRVVSTLSEKAGAGREPDGDNPFLPPDPDLLVGAISPTHVAVLNRFPVLRHHLLVVTREYQEQSLPLAGADFDALARCLAEIDGLGFFNSGPEAGASQPHRHLQLVPFPVGGGPAPTPIERVLTEVALDPSRATLPIFPFRHAVAPLPETAWRADDPAARAAQAMELAYRALARRAGLALVPGAPTAPYNLLATRRWMMVVPRSRERFEGVSVNALGFAGSLLVRDGEQLAVVRRHGPLAVLQGVAVE